MPLTITLLHQQHCTPAAIIGHESLASGPPTDLSRRASSRVLYDIVVRLPIKSLARLRCTCRQLYAEPFMKSRTKRLIEEPKILLASFPERCGPGTKTKPKPKPRFEVAVEFFKASVPQLACPLGPDLLGSCNGLMCFRSNPGVFVIVNPLFEEVLMLSTLPDDIVDLCPPRKKPRSRLQLPRPKDWDNYWCASGLGLDYITEEFAYLPCPSSEDGVLVDLGKRLGLVGFSLAGNIDVWSFDFYGKAWDKKWDIDVSVSPSLESCFDIIGALNQKILLGNDTDLLSYDPRSRKIDRIPYQGLDSIAMAYCVRGGLVSLSRFNLKAVSLRVIYKVTDTSLQEYMKSRIKDDLSIEFRPAGIIYDGLDGQMAPSSAGSSRRRVTSWHPFIYTVHCQSSWLTRALGTRTPILSIAPPTSISGIGLCFALPNAMRFRPRPLLCR
ncbi:hypothetical protein CRG98_021812 [Punica granatum]|uniref:F-box domain-containing protein n=1 Tax=Punica granatum TaxID=22663 RepID=A0A2I0JN86_PUNGR|nr:hypothetical protein CRG98_021812 [Punica granatum]